MKTFSKQRTRNKALWACQMNNWLEREKERERVRDNYWPTAACELWLDPVSGFGSSLTKPTHTHRLSVVTISLRVHTLRNSSHVQLSHQLTLDQMCDWGFDLCIVQIRAHHKYSQRITVWQFTCTRCRSAGSLPALDLCYSNTVSTNISSGVCVWSCGLRRCYSHGKIISKTS